MFQRQIGFLVCFCLVCSLLCFSPVLAEEQDVDFLDPILIISAEPYTETEIETLNELLWQEGFFAIIKVVPENIRPEQIKRIVKEFGKKEKGFFKYVVVDSVLPSGKIEDTETDYFFNEFDQNISISRATKKENLECLSKRPNESQKTTLAFPFLSFYRWLWGCCQYRIQVDPSLMGGEIYLKYSDIITLFEQAGIQKSNRKPTLPLNEENFKKSFFESAVIFGLTTYEPIGQMKEEFGGYDLTIRNTLDRAIWLEDKDKDGYISDDELEIKNFFDFDVLSDNKRRVGIFPQLLEEDIKQELFSSVLCSSEKFGSFVTTGRGNGMDRGMLFVWRHFLEEFLQGKTFGQAWARIPSLIDERFPLENKMMKQTRGFLKLRIKGLPFVRLKTNINVKVQEEVASGQELAIKNLGEIPIRFCVEANSCVMPSKEKGIILSNEEIKISFSFIKTRGHKLFATEPSRKKFVFIRIWFNNAISKTIKIWYYQ